MTTDMITRIGDVMHARLSEAEWKPAPEYGGAVWEMDRSRDGSRVIAAFQESGTFDFTYPFDEFFFVVAGQAVCRLETGETLTFQPGDIGFFPEGTTVQFTMTGGFTDVVLLLTKDRPVAY